MKQKSWKRSKTEKIHFRIENVPVQLLYEYTMVYKIKQQQSGLHLLYVAKIVYVMENNIYVAQQQRLVTASL